MAQDFVAATVLNIDDIKNQLRKASNTINVFRTNTDTIPFKERVVMVKSQAIGNHFTLDHPTNGVLDSSVLELDTGLGALSTDVVQWRNDVVKEFLYHSDFIDVSNSTSSIGDSSVLFDDGDTLRSEDLTTGLGIVVSATFVSAGNVSGSGSFSYYLSADGGSNWESVSLNNLHVFSNVGSQLRYRIDYSGSEGVVSVLNDNNTYEPIRLTYST